MFDDLTRDLEQIHRDISHLQAVITGVQPYAPACAGGTDATGAVRVTLGTDGLADSVSVTSDWQRRLPPEALGDAVVEAHLAAAQQRMAAWMETLEERGWPARLDQPSPEAPLPPPPPQPAPRAAARRDLHDLGRDVRHVFETVDEFARRPALTATGTGSNRAGTLSVTVSSAAGIVSCAVDEQWAARQGGSALGRELTAAVTSARAALAEAAREPDPLDRLDQLLAEVMAHLNHPQAIR
jgi:hypothetical protein